MYKLSNMAKTELLDWNAVYFGIQNDIIPAGTAVDYAGRLAECNPENDSQEIIEFLIIDDINKADIMNLLSKLVSVNDAKKKENEAMRRLRLVILEDLKSVSKNNHELLESVENVYADFNYPEDMNSFIRYMPVEENNYDPFKHSPEENERRLANNFNQFIDEEFKWIKANN